MNTKVLFARLIKQFKCDLVMDIGSRDGAQSLLFRQTLPDATIAAFEANPLNFANLKASRALQENRVCLFPQAVSNQKGKAVFYVAKADYSKPDSPGNNLGVSSLLKAPDSPPMDPVTVDTIRLDEFLMENEWRQFGKIGLWIDVESAEYFVLEGLERAIDRVVVMHVETAMMALRDGQRPLSDIVSLAERYGFEMAGNNIDPKIAWGDVVFVRKDWITAHRWRLRSFQLTALLSWVLKLDNLAAFLKASYPRLYQVLRKALIRRL
jgi:FkbM family methyltransferase